MATQNNPSTGATQMLTIPDDKLQPVAQFLRDKEGLQTAAASGTRCRGTVNDGGTGDLHCSDDDEV
jgi:hypothetical protein